MLNKEKELRRELLVLFIAFITASFVAWLLPLSFLVAFMAGGLDVSVWGIENWVYAGLALLVAAVFTSFQFFLYASDKNLYKTSYRIFLIAVIVFANWFFETSSVMQREDNSVLVKSQNSSVYKEAVKSSNKATESTLITKVNSDLIKAEAKKAKHSHEYNICKTKYKSPARIKKCEDYEIGKYNEAISTIKAIKDAEDKADKKKLKIAEDLRQEARDLSYNEDNHFAMIKVLNSLGITYIISSVILSSIIVLVFEMCFHNLGAMYRRKKDDLYDWLKRNSKSKQSKAETKQVDTESKAEPKKPLNVQEDSQYRQFVTDCLAGKYRTEGTDINSRLYKIGLNKQIGVSTYKAQNIGKEWLERALQEGKIKLNPEWVEGGRIGKYKI